MLSRDAYRDGIGALLTARQSAALAAGKNLQTFRYETAEGTGVQDPDTVKRWICSAHAPGGLELLNLCAYFGPTFTREVLSLIGQNGTTLAEQALRDAVRPHLEAAAKALDT